MGRDEDALAAVTDDIQARGGRALAARADCTIEAEISRAAHTITAQVGPVDILAAFAGGDGMPVPTAKETAAHWREVIESDLTSTFLTTSQFVPAMIERRATQGVDEDVAFELERSSDRALTRGGLAAAAAFLERAASLTPEPTHRARRALAAAQAKHQAGAFDAALGLVAIAESGPLTELQHAQVDLVRGQIALSRGSDAPPLLLKAAKRFEPLDERLARETYLDALTAVFFPGMLASDESCWRPLRPLGQRLDRRSLRARPICCWMAWRC